MICTPSKIRMATSLGTGAAAAGWSAKPGTEKPKRAFAATADSRATRRFSRDTSSTPFTEDVLANYAIGPSYAHFIPALSLGRAGSVVGAGLGDGSGAGDGLGDGAGAVGSCG